jgi:hypothetical protein
MLRPVTGNILSRDCRALPSNGYSVFLVCYLFSLETYAIDFCLQLAVTKTLETMQYCDHVITC